MDRFMIRLSVYMLWWCVVSVSVSWHGAPCLRVSRPRAGHQLSTGHWPGWRLLAWPRPRHRPVQCSQYTGTRDLLISPPSLYTGPHWPAALASLDLTLFSGAATSSSGWCDRGLVTGGWRVTRRLASLRPSPHVASRAQPPGIRNNCTIKTLW